MDTETINGLLNVKPGNEPEQGEVRTFVVEQRVSKKTNKAYLKIKSEKEEYGGRPFRILSAEPTGFVDPHGNVSFNVEIEAAVAQGQFQKARETMGQGRTPKEPTREDEDVAIAPQSSAEAPPARQNGDDGVLDTRKHLMQSANLLVLCIRAAEKAVAPHQPVVAQTAEQFQSDVAKLFIEASSRRTTDGVHWWSYIDKMPEIPLEQ